jgi:hypothetical protein
MTLRPVASSTIPVNDSLTVSWNTCRVSRTWPKWPPSISVRSPGVKMS